MNLFSLVNYREILRSYVDERKKIDRSLSFQKLAEQARIPKSYLSRVMSGKAELSQDQLYLISQYLALNEEEQAYLQLLLELARTSIQARREQLLRRIERIQSRHLDTKRHLKSRRASLEVDLAAHYYLDPIVQIIHVALTLVRYQKAPERIAPELRIGAGRVVQALSKLESIGFIAREKGGRIRVLVDDVHLPKDSPVYAAWRNQLKLLGLHQMDALKEEELYSFSVVFSADENVRKQVQLRFLEFLKEVKALVDKAPQKGVYQLSFDLFPWIRDGE